MGSSITLIKMSKMKSPTEKFLILCVIMLSAILVIACVKYYLLIQKAKCDSQHNNVHLSMNDMAPYERVSNNSRLIYDLLPNAVATETGYWAAIKPTSVEINADGFRDKNYSIETPAAVFRIAAIGDSLTFGFGVESDESYPKVLEKNLNSKNKQTFEVLNLGISGYNTGQEVEFLTDRGLKYHPDLVIVGYFPNDIENTSEFEMLEKKFFSEYANNESLIKAQNYSLKELYVFSSLKAISSIRSELSKTNFSDAFRSVNESLKKLSLLSLNNSFKVMIVFIPGNPGIKHVYQSEQKEAIKHICEENNWCFLNLEPIYDSHNLWNEVLDPQDPHPNPYAYSIISEEIYKKLAECRIISE